MREDHDGNPIGKEKTTMRLRVATLAPAAIAASLLLAATAHAQSLPESFSGTASAKSEAKSGTAPVRIRIDAWSSMAQRDAVMAALKKGGTPAVRQVLSGMKDVGLIEVGESKAPIRYAFARPIGGGRVVTIVTDNPLLHLGAGLPDAKPTTGYDVAVAVLVLDEKGSGHAELSPAAKVKADESGAVVVEDYGPVKVWIKDLARAK
jgi:hypothetical protein